MFVLFRLLGKDYDAAVMISGFLGHGLGQRQMRWRICHRPSASMVLPGRPSLLMYSPLRSSTQRSISWLLNREFTNNMDIKAAHAEKSAGRLLASKNQSIEGASLLPLPARERNSLCLWRRRSMMRNSQGRHLCHSRTVPSLPRDCGKFRSRRDEVKSCLYRW